MALLSGKADAAKQWEDEAVARQAAMNKYLWNEAKGMYFDYDDQTGSSRITTT